MRLQLVAPGCTSFARSGATSFDGLIRLPIVSGCTCYTHSPSRASGKGRCRDGGSLHGLQLQPGATGATADRTEAP